MSNFPKCMKDRYFKGLFVLPLLFILNYSNDCFAQLSQVVSASGIYSPPSPNAAALLKYANVPIDEHTGIASVVLPVDQLISKQITVPITLSYHGSGIKVQDIASNVGLGFVLNAGGVITRVMRGLPDESNNGYQYYGKKVYAPADSAYLNATINNKIDGEPDMFYFNFLGHTGKMVFDTLGHPAYLPDQGIRVIKHPIHSSPDSVTNGWILKDFSGVTYEFGTDTSSKELTLVGIEGKPISDAISYVSSWYITRIISADGKDTINFNYSTGPNMGYTQYRNILTYTIHDDITIKRTSPFTKHTKRTDNNSAQNVNTINVNTSIQVLSPKYLSSIRSNMGWITFSYNSRSDLSGGQALYQMKTYTVNDSATPLKTYTFNESYFMALTPDISDYNNKRLRLDCVNLQGRSSEVKQLYVFTYNGQTQLPPRNSNEFDHWGYYTTLRKRSGAYPPLNLTLDQLGNYDDGFELRAPDSVRAQACVLTKVRNLNGGYTKFYYSLNDYKYNGGDYTGGGIRIKQIAKTDSLGQITPITTRYDYTGSDLRSSGMIYNPKPYYIQGVTNYIPNTLVQPIPGILDYYKNHRLSTLISVVGIAGSVILSANPIGLVIDVAALVFPAIKNIISFFTHRTVKQSVDSPPFSISSTPLNNLFDINGASVTYSRITTRNNNGGKTINTYTSQQEYPDTTSAVVLNYEGNAVSPIYGNTGSYPPATSFDFERGKLKESLSLDTFGRVVSRTVNTYKLSPRVAVVSGQRASVGGYASVGSSYQVIKYNVGLYNEISQNIQLIKSVTTLADPTTFSIFNEASRSLTTTHNYTWQPSYPTLLHSESTFRSDGKLLVTYNTYPMEYTSGTPFLDDMVHHYQLGLPIEQITALQDGSSLAITSGILNKYKTGGYGLLDTVFALSASNPIPLSGFKFSNQNIGAINSAYQTYHPDHHYIGQAFYQAYDSKNNLTQMQGIGKAPYSTIWGYNQSVPIAQISNATIDKVAYTSFETNDQQYWSFTASGRDSAALAKTGKVRYKLSSGTVETKANIPTGTYILSLWSNGSKPTFSGTTADAAIVNGESDNHGWNFYMDRITVAGGSKVSLSGTGLIDEVRLYPQGAHMNSVAITPQVGAVSTTAQDDKASSFEYDALQRLKLERDDQYNIVKEYSYSNVPAVANVDTPSRWKGINPVCYTDLTHLPEIHNYKAFATNNFGNILCFFNRDDDERKYVARVDYTIAFSDSTFYSDNIILKENELNTMAGLTLEGKTAEAVLSMTIDTVINLTDDYGATFQRYTNRQRLSDGYVEANTQNDTGLGPFIAPIESSDGCPLPLFSNREQTQFFKNDCTVAGAGDEVTYTVAAGTYTATTQFAADSAARAAGQAYANAHGTCTVQDTTYVGIDPYCVTSTAHTGTPNVADYTAALNNINVIFRNIFNVLIIRSTAESAYDATVTYTVKLTDGSTVPLTTTMYKDQAIINVMPNLPGYSASKVAGVSITAVNYTSLTRQAFTNRKRLINGVADGHTETNSTGTNYVPPVANPAACNSWFYNTTQTGFYRNDCTAGPGSEVSYTVVAHTDSSKISQAAADILARARGQYYANTHGACYSSADTLVSTYAGNIEQGIVNGPLLSAEFYSPRSIAIDQNNNLYVSDGYNGSNIRKITPDGVTNFAGGTPYGYADGTGEAALFNSISGMVTDPLGNLYVCDDINHKIRKVTPGAVVTTFAGSSLGHVNGTGTSAEFSNFNGITIAPSGNLYVIDDRRIREVTPAGVVTDYAGNNTQAYLDGAASSAEFYNPSSITSDSFGNIYVADNGRIRKISGGSVSTIAGDGTTDGFQNGTGTGAKFGFIEDMGMATDKDGNIYIADIFNGCIRKVTPSGVVTTLTTHVGSGGGVYKDGPIATAGLTSPWGIVFDSYGNIYTTEDGRIRKITFPE